MSLCLGQDALKELKRSSFSTDEQTHPGKHQAYRKYAGIKHFGQAHLLIEEKYEVLGQGLLGCNTASLTSRYKTHHTDTKRIIMYVSAQPLC
jgi:hypothetical protein